MTGVTRPSPIPSVIDQQRRWAKSQGLETTNAFLSSLADNLRAELSTGALTIQFFLNFLRRRSLSFFVWYRVIFGIIVIALATFFRYHGG